MKINLFLTLDCNMKCSYCYLQNKCNDYMTLDTAYKAIDFVLMNTLQKERLTIIFQGGEPLLNWSVLKESVEYCKKQKHKYGFAITTNGSLLKKEHIDFFKENTFQLRLSIDGNKESHDLNRKFKNKEGTFDSVKNSLELFKSYNSGKKTIRMTITVNNIRYLYESIVYLIENNINNIVLALNIFDNWDNLKIKMITSSINKLADYYIDSIKNKKFISMPFFDDIITKTFSSKGSVAKN